MKLASLKIASLILMTLFTSNTFANESTQDLKSEIIRLAKSYEGQGDPDFSKQKNLDLLVNKLLLASPQPPVAQRLQLIIGPWKQIWGPYNYRNSDRVVDPELGTKEIYQVVFDGGYYYNASYLYKNGDQNKERIALLRGEYKVDENKPDILKVKFTRYPGLEERVQGFQLWQLPALSESGDLKNEITIVPTWIVKLFFGGGALREVYTDGDLRIL